jgi:membrane associated rhomboid family serine protease
MAWHERDYYREAGGFGGGGGGFSNPFSGGSLSVTMWLLIINCAVFVIDMILAAGVRSGQVPWLTMIGNFNVEQGIFGGQIWRVITYQFLHAGIFHILVNMLVLYFFGPLMEHWWGSRRYLAFYLLCGVSGAILMTLLAPILPLISTEARLVGASGSIFGILVGAAVLFPQQRVMLLIPPIPMTLRTLAFVLLGITALQMIAGANTGGNAAHLGGAALGFLFVKNPRWLDWADRFGGSPSRPSPRQKVKQKMQEVQQAQKKREEEEVDRILDKVKQQGIQSLTKSEKKTLNRATENRNQPR